MAGRSCVRQTAKQSLAKQSLEKRLVEAARSGDAYSVNHLLNKGAHVNAVLATGETAIGVAAQNGDITIIRLLLDFDNVCHSDAASRSSSSISNKKACNSDVVYGTDPSSDYCKDKRTLHCDAVSRYDDSDTNNYSTSSSIDKRPCYSDVTCVYDQRNTISDSRSGHSDSVYRLDTSKYSSFNGTKTDKSRCHSDARLDCDCSAMRSNTVITDKRTCHCQTIYDPYGNPYYGIYGSPSDPACVYYDFERKKYKTKYHNQASCAYNLSAEFNDKRTGQSDVTCNGVEISEKRRCHSDAACDYDRSTVGNSNTDKRTCHSDAVGVDDVRTSFSNNVSDKNNCGYFVVYHEDVCEQDENENCNLEGKTPEGMDQLEWDVEVRDGVKEEEEEEEGDAVWSCQYKWYADILDKTQCYMVAQTPDLDVRLGRAGEKCQVNLQDVHGCTALHYAAIQGHFELVRLLIEAGGQVDMCDASSQTPLHLAAAHGHTHVVEQLIEACQGARRQLHLVNVATGDTRCMTALHFAATRGQWRTCGALVARGAHINAVDSYERTPLFLAVVRQHLKTARLLLSLGANANIEDIFSKSAMCEAVWNKDVAMVDVLATQGGQIRISPSHQLLHYAVLHRHAAMVDLLLPLQSHAHVNLPSHPGGDTPLMLAARTRQLGVLGLLIKHGAKTNAVNTITGSTPLISAVESLIDHPSYQPPETMSLSPPTMTSSSSATSSVTSSFEDVVRLLVAYGADLNYCGAMGEYSPLTKLIVLKKFGMAAFLIRIGADVNKSSTLNEYVFDNLLLARSFKQFTLVKMIVYAGYELTREKVDVLSEMGTPKGVAIDSWIQHTNANVWPLTHLCRLVIRKQLVSHCGSRTRSYCESQNVSQTQLQDVTHCDPTFVSDALPIPNVLKRFIRMEEFQVEDQHEPSARLASYI